MIDLIDLLKARLFEKKMSDFRWGKSKHQGSHKPLANDNIALKKKRRKMERQNRKAGR